MGQIVPIRAFTTHSRLAPSHLRLFQTNNAQIVLQICSWVASRVSHHTRSIRELPGHNCQKTSSRTMSIFLLRTLSNSPKTGASAATAFCLTGKFGNRVCTETALRAFGTELIHPMHCSSRPSSRDIPEAAKACGNEKMGADSCPLPFPCISELPP